MPITSATTIVVAFLRRRRLATLPWTRSSVSREGSTPCTSRSSIPRTSSLIGFQLLAQSHAGSMHAAADRDGLDAEHFAGLLRREAEPIHQHESLSLVGRQRREEATNLRTRLDRRGHVLDMVLREHPPSSSQRSSESASMQIQRGPIEIPVGGVH